MHQSIRNTVLVGLICFSAASTAASAEREAAGWSHWADFTSKVVDAGKVTPFDGPAVTTACTGVVGMISGQGFQFPYWAQNVNMACQAFKTYADVDGKRKAGIDKGSTHAFFSGNLRKMLKREKKALCRDLSSIVKQLGKAEPVASEPRAQPLAMELRTQMETLQKSAECD